ncbi:hypothetical protein [Paratractidigestivibacter sp.]|uniref:hypothetical protein n=1 Tax=Paratractidigestivibacter sp. TaxID=2847316 RepID=UPI002AC98551|nr:hypothetical protein [Paratractidigestivibacter sp.]
MAMCLILPLLMCYALAGELLHEHAGMLTCCLFAIHLWLNRGWIRAIARGRYRARRTVLTAVVVALASSMVITMVTGVLSSRCLFPALSAQLGSPVIEVAHMSAAHWAFLLASAHAGLNLAGLMTRVVRRSGKVRSRALLVVGAAWAAYVTWAFFSLGVPRYLLAQNHFAIIDFAEPAWHCMLDYCSIMVAVAVLAAFAARTTRPKPRPKRPSDTNNA